MTGIVWVIVSYILGSIPFGYLMGRLSGKNVLEIGWRKTSGSNVFKNVGKWQGTASGLLDVLKGYLAVYFAQQLGFGSEIQVLSGVAAVVGHNWSCFLRMAGGRGIGTFIGAFFALSPQLLGYSIIPLLVFALVWNAAIGTILFLAAAIILSLYFNQFGTVGWFTVLTLLPVFVKRLSPIDEISKVEKPWVLFRNRFIFDNDQSLMSLRIKRILKKEKENPSTLIKVALVPPKAGWAAAKFGAKMAKKPIDMLMANGKERVVTELSPEDFKSMMLAASKKIVLHQEEINKINVFPVADKDTGYNLAATLLGIEGVVSRKNYTDFKEITQDMKTALMVNARGNAGMIYTGYLVEVLDKIKHLDKVEASHLALAMSKGIKAARASIAEPVDGTILDTTKAAGDKAYEIVKTKKETNIIKVLEEAYKASEIALKETPEKLEVLKKNNVVDAGALGYVKILEAWVEELKGITPKALPEVANQAVDAPIADVSTESLQYPIEVVLSFRKPENMDLEEVKADLLILGDSLEVIEVDRKVKLHIHTDNAESVINNFKHLPEFEQRTEDMQKQIERKPLGLVIDQIAELPEDFIQKHNITEVPFTIRFPDGEIITSKGDIYAKMREALKTGRKLPTTSAPPFKEFITAYQKAFQKFDQILVITISSKLSGTYSSARIARSIFKKPKKLDIYVFDCFTVEIAESLIVMKAQELINQGKNREEIIEYLTEFCPKVTLLGCVDDFQYIVRGGRFKLPVIAIKPLYLIQKLGIRVLITLKNGKLKLLGVRFGKDAAKVLAKEMEKQRAGKRVKAAIAHAENEKEANLLKTELENLEDVDFQFSSSVSPVIGTHTGPGVLILAFFPIDK